MLKWVLIVGLILTSAFGLYYLTQDFMQDKTEKNNKIIPELSEPKSSQKASKMLLILAAPSIHDKYYADHFKDIVDFQVQYAQKVIQHNADDILILVDADTKHYYADRLPNKILITEEMYDIWMRDFTTINPANPVQFAYTDASMSKEDSIQTQKKFSSFADKYSIKRQHASYLLDGGNIVDNYAGKIITTTRFLKDNSLQYEEGKKILKELLQASNVAIIEPDDEILAHSDGMVAWIDDNILAVNDYSQIDSGFHSMVIDELQHSFPDSKIITVPVLFDKEKGIDQTRGIGSACGINLNLVATYTTLYVPVFGNEYEKESLEIIKKNTSKQVIEIDAKNICLFGGSVRCTTWQILEKNAGKL
jgi:agmatine/peptidylarginine deiminase